MVVQTEVVTFWELLHEFAQSSSVPGSWRILLPLNTPFLPFPGVNCRLQVSSVPLLVAVHAVQCLLYSSVAGCVLFLFLLIVPSEPLWLTHGVK